ncbi:MAG: hypothetical protein WCV67_05360 [Victivallaceae bacterium]|jgi:hypothetical protein
MKRIEQTTLIVTFLTFSWLAMQAVHEFGHVIGAWLTNAEVIKVVLHPCVISRTDITHNQHPLVVVWAGPVIGSALPLLAFLAAKIYRTPMIYMFRFFAGFCLIANGVYIAFGPVDGAADTGVMIQHGSPRWIMLVFGILTVLPGLYLWNRQGEYFGLGNANAKVSRRATIISGLLLVAAATLECIINSR